MKAQIYFVIISMSMVMGCNNENTADKSLSNNNTNQDIVTQNTNSINLPKTIRVENIAQNPEGIEYNKNDQTFFLSSLNATPIIKVQMDGSYQTFTSGESFPLSTAGLQINYSQNQLLAAGFNGLELMDNDPNTKGAAFLRIYNLKTGAFEKDINLSKLIPEANAYFANDIAIDNKGNTYVSDWYAHVIYKVDEQGTPSIFWTNNTKLPSGPNGLDFHPDGYLLVSLLNVNEKGLYADFGLVKIPINNPSAATLVNIPDSKFTGFDGMVITSDHSIVGISNDGKSPGGNLFVELSSSNGWNSAIVAGAKSIAPSTTVAVTPNNLNYVINQDFTDNFAKNWTIEQVTL